MILADTDITESGFQGFIHTILQNTVVMDEWKFELFNDMKCIVRSMTPETYIQSKIRKITKEELGRTYTGFVMLDSKTTKKGQVLCDGIIISNRLSWWKCKFEEIYRRKGYSMAMSEMTWGCQTTWKSKDVSIIDINLYPTTSKKMVAYPRQREENLFLLAVGYQRNQSSRKNTC